MQLQSKQSLPHPPRIKILGQLQTSCSDGTPLVSGLRHSIAVATLLGRMHGELTVAQDHNNQQHPAEESFVEIIHGLG